jgi:hypothetical protein
MDFGAISTRDQLARLQSGTVKADQFDWAAMAFDFGPKGRKALADIAKSPDKAKADLAKWALATKNRWDLNVAGEPVDAAEVSFGAKPIREKVRVLPAGQVLADDAYKAIDERGQCRAAPCAAYVLGPDQMVVIGKGDNVVLFARDAKTRVWQEDYQGFSGAAMAQQTAIDDVDKATIEVRPITRRQVFVNGKPVGDDFR